MFVIQVKIEDQLPVVGEVDEQLQYAANVGFQKGLLPEEEIAEEQWRLKDGAMAAFNTIFEGYKTINTGFMELSKLIAIQDSAARSVREGEDEGGWKMRERQRRKLVRWGGAERRVGRGQNERRPLAMMTAMGHAKFPQEKKQHQKKGDTHDVQDDSTLKLSPGPSHDLTPEKEITKARSKEGKRKVKKVGPGGIFEPVSQMSSTGARYYSFP